MPFEYFNDPCYYDMWAVRDIVTCSMNDTAHVATEAEAEWLTKRLNALEAAQQPANNASHVICCNVVCEYCEGCVDLVPKEKYSCFRGRKLQAVA